VCVRVRACVHAYVICVLICFEFLQRDVQCRSHNPHLSSQEEVIFCHFGFIWKICSIVALTPSALYEVGHIHPILRLFNKLNNF